ncbi:MAG: hypothetical protein IJJ98_08155 [Prevotella sp.]|nr:hypothetical protein [Prevotella sp.]
MTVVFTCVQFAPFERPKDIERSSAVLNIERHEVPFEPRFSAIALGLWTGTWTVNDPAIKQSFLTDSVIVTTDNVFQ